jgi:hypothetical protein
VIRIERTLAATDALAAMGWTKEEVDNLMTMVTGKDPLSGLGYDGPLAAFSKVRRNLVGLLSGAGGGGHQSGDRPGA